MVLCVSLSAPHSGDASTQEVRRDWPLFSLWLQCGGQGQSEREGEREERKRDLNPGLQRIRQPDRVDLE